MIVQDRITAITRQLSRILGTQHVIGKKYNPNCNVDQYSTAVLHSNNHSAQQTIDYCSSISIYRRRRQEKMNPTK